MTKLDTYIVPNSINYIAAFLTMGCQLRCSYCINRAGKLVCKPTIPYQTWVKGLSRFITRPDLPITLQGGEPTTYKGVYELIQHLPDRIQLDILTNGQFDIDKFVQKVNPKKFGREAKYAPIRFSFHAEQMDANDTIDRILKLKEHGFKVGVWAVDHPVWKRQNHEFMEMCLATGIDFRWKDYLDNGYGEYKIPHSVFQKKTRDCSCRTTEILISPTGYFHRCHADLYADRFPIGHILDKKLPMFEAWRPCAQLGQCNPCDLKVKTNRFQEYGHTSVQILEGVQ